MPREPDSKELHQMSLVESFRAVCPEFSWFYSDLMGQYVGFLGPFRIDVDDDGTMHVGMNGLRMDIGYSRVSMAPERAGYEMAEILREHEKQQGLRRVS